MNLRTGLVLLLACASFAATTVGCAATPTTSTGKATKNSVAGEDEDEDEKPSSPKKTENGSTPAPAPATPSSPTPTPAANTFLDDFGRADGALGNGWVERTPGAYQLASGQAEQMRVGPIVQLLNLRPMTEDASDVEVSVDVTSDADWADPGVFARASFDAQGNYGGYAFYFDGGGAVVVDRVSNGAFAPLGRAQLSRVLDFGDKAHLTFKVTGANPVVLQGTVTDANGAMLGQVTFSDASEARIARGSVGFGSSDAAFAQYDNFKRVTLAP